MLVVRDGRVVRHELAPELEAKGVRVCDLATCGDTDDVQSVLGTISSASPDAFTMLHEAKPVLLNLGEPSAVDVSPWAERVRRIDATYTGSWELPVLGAVAAPTAVLIRPDGHVAWVGGGTDQGLHDALTRWSGPTSPVRDPADAAKLVP
jgi:hypothetical protein